MTWTTTDINTNDIIQQDGVFAYNFEASGTIYKGQAVYLSNDNTVGTTSSTPSHADAIGFATYGATAGEQVGVAGPGNIVVCCMDDNASAVGTYLYGDTDGVLDATQGNAKRPIAVLADNSPSDVSGSVAATNHVIKALVI